MSATSKKFFFLSLLIWNNVAVVLAQDNDDDDTLFSGCSLSEYYAPLPGTSYVSWGFDEVAALVTGTHRNELPLLGDVLGADDIYRAVTDLDRGMKNNTVRLIYRDIDMNATPYGNPLYWDIERLWPESRGTSRPSLAFTDVHHIRPADYSVKETRAGLSFGECGTVQLIQYCSSPATVETPSDTATDGKIWLPPARYRGDVARAMLYVDLRYRMRAGALDRSLTLQDCGPFEDYGMGYLSQLLQWHAEDPPDNRERARNDRACGRWQGNRNPFVDYPELAAQFHGQPQPLLEQSLIYQSCVDIPTPSPTATPNECSGIRPGDVPFFMLNSDEPQEVLFFPLTDIPPGVELYITDNAWNGNAFIETEGSVTMTVPAPGIRGGTSFGYGPSANLNELWEADGDFHLNTNGDNLFLYCLDADELPHFISAISYTGGGGSGGNGGDGGTDLADDIAATTTGGSDVELTGDVSEEMASVGVTSSANTMEVSWWMPPGQPDYGESTTALPDELRDSGALYLPVHYDNNMYNGTRSGGVGLLRITFMDPSNWEGSNVARFEIVGGGSGSGGEDDGSDGSDSSSSSSSLLTRFATTRMLRFATITTITSLLFFVL